MIRARCCDRRDKIAGWVGAARSCSGRAGAGEATPAAQPAISESSPRRSPICSATRRAARRVDDHTRALDPDTGSIR
jgi:hypothetical protein